MWSSRISLLRKRMALIIGVVAIFGILGCQPETRYKTLSFFFDGVPNPQKKDQAQSNNANNANKNAAEKVRYREHGPFAAKLCGGCHVPGTNNLIAPIEELCLRCHTTVVLTGKKKIHGPGASGGCKVCHEPHGSAYPYFLVADSKTFCLHCHNKSDIMKREVHQGQTVQCTTCHDAHSSDNEYLLK